MDPMVVNEPVMMGWILPAIMAASALFKGIGSLKKKKAEQTLKKEEDQNLYAAQEGQFNNNEDARLQRLNTLKGLAGTRGGIDWSTVDPNTFTARHKFSGVLPSKNTGTSVIGDVLSGLGDAGSSYGASEYGNRAADKQEDWLVEMTCKINPASPLCPKQTKSPLGSYEPEDPSGILG